VNAVAHRDYTSNGSVQVMLFADRLEIWNPGTLPASLTIEKLRHPHGSVPHNPLLAEPLYLTKYIERMGTGTGDMIHQCQEIGLPEPQFSISDGFVTTIWRKPYRDNAITGEVTEEIKRIVLVVNKEMKRVEIQHALGLRHEDHFRDAYLTPGLQAGFIEMTISEKPKSSRQKYRLTAQGLALKTILIKHST